MPRHSIGGELRSIRESTEWAEVSCGRQTYKIEAWYRRLEVGVKDGCVVDGLDLATKTGIEKAKALQPNLVAGSGDDVIDMEFSDGTVSFAEDETETISVSADLFEAGAQMKRHMANNLALRKPAGRGPIDAMKGPEPEPFGKRVVHERKVGAETGWPTLPKSRTRHENALEERSRFGSGRIVEGDGVTAGNHVGVGT